MKGIKLGTTQEEKDVVVYVIPMLKPSTRCKKAADKAFSVIKQITKNYGDKHTFLKPCKQYIRPRREFASPAWSL
jgi:hypothetical protein